MDNGVFHPDNMDKRYGVIDNRIQL